MLLGFISLMQLVNVIFQSAFQVSFDTILGYIFAPIAFLMGVPWAEAVQAGGIKPAFLSQSPHSIQSSPNDPNSLKLQLWES